MSTAQVDATIALDMSQLPAGFLAAVRGIMTVPNPERQQLARAGLSGGNLPPWLHLWEQRDGWLHVPRGAVKRVQAQAHQHGVTLAWASTAVTRAEQRVPLESLPVQLRPYQMEAVRAMLYGVQGYIVAPCGAGKTVMACGAMVGTGEPGLVLVHTHDLMMQWVTLLRAWGYRVRAVSGGFSGSRWHPLAMVRGQPEFAVVMVQALDRAGAAADPLLRSAGVVVLDECHHAPATTFRTLMARIPARYRWGVTATPERGDGLTSLLALVLGEQLYEVGTQQLLDAGFLMRPVIVPVFSGTNVNMDACMSPSGQLIIGKAVTLLVDCPARHRFILELVGVAVAAGRTVLVLVPRVEQADQLALDLRAGGVAAAAATSGTPKAQRAQQLRQLRERRLAVLVATQLADEGLDVPALDCVVVASTGRAAGRAVQRIGRVMRCAPGKGQPIVVDVVDGTPFRGQWRARQEAYQQALGVVAPHPVPRCDAVQVLREVLRKNAGST